MEFQNSLKTIGNCLNNKKPLKSLENHQDQSTNNNKTESFRRLEMFLLVRNRGGAWDQAVQSVDWFHCSLEEDLIFGSSLKGKWCGREVEGGIMTRQLR